MEHGRPGGSRGMVNEKVEKGTWKKLVKYCKKYIAIIVIAVICAATGSVLTLVGPDKLSEITDVVTEGIIPDTDKLEEISEKMSDSMSDNMELLTTKVSENVSENMSSIMTAISENLSNTEGISENAMEIMQSEEISAEDKAAFQSLMAGMQAGGQVNLEEMQTKLMSLPTSICNILFEDVTVNGVKISVEEQFETIKCFSGLDMEDSEAAMNAMKDLPESVENAMYTDIEVNESVITSDDQIKMMDAFKNIDMESGDSQAAMDAMDNLPESVKAALYSEIVIDGNAISGEDQRAMIDIMSNVDEDDTNAALEAFDNLPDSIVNIVKPSIDIEKIVKIAVLLVILYIIGSVLSATQGWIMATITQKVSKQLRIDISEKINRLPMSYYYKHTTGDVLSRVTNDVDTISTSLNMSIGTLVSAITLFVGSLIMMTKTNIIMTITGIITTIFGFALMMLIMGRSQKYFTRQQKHLGALNGHIEEIYSGHTVVKAYNGEQKAMDEFRKLNDKLRDSGFKAQALSGLMMPLMGFIGNFGYVAVCVVGAVLVLDGKISFGVIISFMMYIRFFTQPLSQMAQAAQALQSAGAAASRVFEFIEAEEMEDESAKKDTLTNVKGDVSFSHIQFGYNEDKVIIKDFSATAKAGQKIAIVGPTGAGKTTMVNLLMRFYEISKGEIKIDGTPISKVKREDVHSQFCMVLQDTWLFEGTVRENLIYCSENNSEDKMKEACKAVGLDHFIRTLPKGYDTILDDQVNLSQGQKQQLTIARAMIADKPILILDEATSSIDTRTEQKIQKAMDELMKGRTSFVIAHRLSTIKNADLILVLKDGDVIESGNHENLMEKNGFYADLYNSQFEQA